jgi:hypothetical protein
MGIWSHIARSKYFERDGHVCLKGSLGIRLEKLGKSHIDGISGKR